MVSNPGCHIVLLDFRAAYDTVDRRLLWQKLRQEYQVPEAMIFMLSALFDYNTSTILVKNTKSSPIDNIQGLLQGSSLSPLLFNLFINSMAVTLQAPGLPKVNTFGFASNMLLFADDAVIFAKSLQATKALLGVCEEWADENRMRFAPHKCIHIAPSTPDNPHGAVENLKLYNLDLNQQEAAKYLGLFFTEHGLDLKRSIEERCQKANGATKMLSEIGMNGSGWTYASSALAYKMFIRPVMEYGIALRPLGAESNEMKSLERCQNHALRQILGVPASTSISAMHKVLLIEPMLHRNRVLNAQFTARLHNNNDAAIPAVVVWRNKIARGKQTHGTGSRLNPEFVNREMTSLVNEGVFKNPLWSKAYHTVHALEPLRHPRLAFGRGPEERHTMPVSVVRKAFTTSQKKMMRRLATVNMRGNVEGHVSKAVELNVVEGYRAICLPNPAISREDRMVIMRWTLGLVCQHQKCAECGEDLSRNHGLECAGVRVHVENLLLRDHPTAFDVREGADPTVTWLDNVINALRHCSESKVTEAISGGIRLCLTKCRGLVQRENGYWGTPEDAEGRREEHKAQWEPAPNAQIHNINYNPVQNPAQTLARAENARIRNRQTGRRTRSNPNRLRTTEYVPQEQRLLETARRRVHIIVDEESSSEEEEEMDRTHGEAAAPRGVEGPPSPQHARQRHSARCLRRSEETPSNRDLFEDERDLDVWASTGNRERNERAGTRDHNERHSNRDDPGRHSSWDEEEIALREQAGASGTTLGAYRDGVG